MKSTHQAISCSFSHQLYFLEEEWVDESESLSLKRTKNEHKLLSYSATHSRQKGSKGVWPQVSRHVRQLSLWVSVCVCVCMCVCVVVCVLLTAELVLPSQVQDLRWKQNQFVKHITCFGTEMDGCIDFFNSMITITDSSFKPKKYIFLYCTYCILCISIQDCFSYILRFKITYLPLAQYCCKRKEKKEKQEL